LNSHSYGGTTYPIVTEPRCHTCLAPERTTIEILSALGVGYTAIARQFPAGPSSQSIRRHALRDHVPVRSEVLRQALDAAGGERTAVLTQGVQAALTRLARAAEAIPLANERLLSGAAPLTAAQAIKVAGMFMEYDLALHTEERMQTLLDTAHDDLAQMLSLVKKTTAPDTWTEIVRAIDRDPNLRPYVFEAYAA
jgi:hypothetical protein